MDNSSETSLHLMFPELPQTGSMLNYIEDPSSKYESRILISGIHFLQINLDGWIFDYISSSYLFFKWFLKMQIMGYK